MDDEEEFLKEVQKMKDEGIGEKERAEKLGMSVTSLRTYIAICKSNLRTRTKPLQEGEKS